MKSGVDGAVREGEGDEMKLPDEREVLILYLLHSRGEFYGLMLLDVFDNLAKQHGLPYRLPIGTVYQSMNVMEKSKWVRWHQEDTRHAKGGNKRKVFSITNEGRKAMIQYAKRVSRVLDILNIDDALL